MATPTAYVGSLDRPGTWRGLGAADRALLAEALQGLFPKTAPVWFHVPIGRGPRDAALPTPPDDTDPQAAPYFKRIDLLITLDDVLYVVEIKPAAGYVALGQVITYAHLLAQQWPDFAHARPAILTDEPDPDLAALTHAQGVTVFATHQQPYIPRGRPT